MSDSIEERDWFGTWVVKGNTRELMERSEEYIASLTSSAVIPEPTQEEINLEFDYRLCLVELGLQ